MKQKIKELKKNIHTHVRINVHASIYPGKLLEKNGIKVNALITSISTDYQQLGGAYS